MGSVEGLIVIYALKQHQKLKVLEGHKEAVTALAFNKEGSRMVSYSQNEKVIRVWEVTNFKLLCRLMQDSCLLLVF